MKTSHAPGRVSLPRAISKLGFASRSQACRLIEDGSVRVNNKVELNLHRWVDIENDRIEIQSQTLKREAFRYVILHKPRGVVTTRSDERGERTVFDVLGERGEGLKSVGRLDKETTGLLLFTNDHQLANRVTSPDVSLSKTYVASIDRPIRDSDLQVLSEGMEIRSEGKDVITRPARVSVRQPLEVEISITEGKNRQVRKMLEELGYAVTGLRRIAVGPLLLRDLGEGESREMSVEEVNSLKSALGSKEIRKASPKSHSWFQRKKAGGSESAFGSTETKSEHPKSHTRFQRKRTGGSKSAPWSKETKSEHPKSHTRFQKKRTGGSKNAPWSKETKPEYPKSHTRFQRKKTGGSHRKPSR
ncbi:MAG: pseudouridine synthase [Ignavibacteriales bacterium]|nr:pseudouridine synthase [Ignavibacteriales bacterium]